MCKSIPVASIPPSNPRAFVARWITVVRHLEFTSVPAPRAFANVKNILLSFPTALRVKGYKHRHFRIRRAFIDNKRPIKAIKPFVWHCSVGVTHFVTCFMQFYWTETVMFIKNIAFNVYVYWSDERGYRAFDHYSRNGWQEICHQNLAAGSGICPIFLLKSPAGSTWNML